MYGNNQGLAAQGTGFAAGAAIGQQSQANAISKATQLESHLHAIRALNETLGGGVSRATNMADRLVGHEPTNVPTGSPPKDANEIPLLARIEDALRLASQFAESIHYQLNRLERL